ncbi:hypothetical protein C8Q80DRAFT_949193 [Daedaleopsis nitida]|nr:hypothetical protein C8Q80DRAFT_949193 [Daedaleopsis nitida]
MDASLRACALVRAYSVGRLHVVYELHTGRVDMSSWLAGPDWREQWSCICSSSRRCGSRRTTRARTSSLWTSRPQSQRQNRGVSRSRRCDSSDYGMAGSPLRRRYWTARQVPRRARGASPSTAACEVDGPSCAGDSVVRPPRAVGLRTNATSARIHRGRRSWQRVPPTSTRSPALRNPTCDRRAVRLRECARVPDLLSPGLTSALARFCDGLPEDGKMVVGLEDVSWIRGMKSGLTP